MPSEFNNPILSGFFPDPSCIHVNGKFYMVTSTFQFFPAVTIHVSEDLLNWKQLGSGISRPDLLDLTKAKVRGPCSDGIFACSIRHHQGTFYIVTSNVSLDYAPTNFILTSTDPESGVWSDPIPVAFHGMDPSLFFDDDGKVYYQGAQFPIDPSKGMMATISQAEIDIATGNFIGDLKPIWQGCSKGTWPEGPHLYKREKWYYTLLAEGGTHRDHSVTIARSESPWGPWESYAQNPVLTHKGTDNYIQGVGHADIFEDKNGAWWAVFLGHRVKGESFPLGRETFLCPVDWSEDGWPVFNGGQPIKSKMSIDREPLAPSSSARATSEYSLVLSDSLPDLMYIRNPNPENYVWGEDNALTLRADATATLDTELGTSTFTGVRQRHLDAEFSTQIRVKSSSAKGKAGISVYVDNFRHLDLSITTSSTTGERCIQLCATALGKEATTQETPLPINSADATELSIVCTELEYVFRYRLDADGEWQDVGRIPTAMISEWGFTGPVLGLFACALEVSDSRFEVVATGTRYVGGQS